jgi:hypothetical protein
MFHFLNFGNLFSFLVLCSVSRNLLTWDQPVARLLPTDREQTNKRMRIGVPLVAIEFMTLEFELAKTVHASDGAATVSNLNRTKFHM